MAGATFGRLLPFGDTFLSADPLRRNASAISGVGSKRLISGDPDFEDTAESFGRSPFNGALAGGLTVQGFAGPCKISGYCYVNGVPVPFIRCLLIPQIAPSLVVREAFSDANGFFQFIDVAYTRYIVLGIDQTATYNASVFDFVQAYQ